MIPYNQAQDILSRQEFSPPVETIPLKESLQRILAQDIVSPIDVPPFSKSAMDGYAIRGGDVSTAFRVVDVIPAGKQPEREISVGECAKIMTGAMLPEGADRVIRKEAAREEEGIMRITGTESKSNVLRRGEDITTGQKVLERGALLRPAEIAFLASIGVSTIGVARRPVIALIITGSELVEPGAPLPSGKIYNSNFHSLSSQIRAMGVLMGPSLQAADDPAAIESAVRAALDQSDLVILSGGVSAGDFDFVPQVLKRCNVQFQFEQVAVQPGKPTLFGRRGDKFFFGLPGNPVSAFIIFEVFIKPLLYRMMGHVHLPQIVPGILQQGVPAKKGGRTQILPVEFRDGIVNPLPYHGSAHLHALTSANALLTIAAGSDSIPAGATVHVRLL